MVTAKGTISLLAHYMDNMYKTNPLMKMLMVYEYKINEGLALCVNMYTSNYYLALSMFNGYKQNCSIELSRVTEYETIPHCGTISCIEVSGVNQHKANPHLKLSKVNEYKY